MTKKLLSGLVKSVFLRQHWQKKPLLARQALPEYKELLDRDALFGLAARDDVQSRLVIHNRGRWQERAIVQFAGQFLTEPKPHVVFDRPQRPLTPITFAARAARHGVRLVLKTQMLCRGCQVFINGERCEASSTAARLLLRLADYRRLPPHAAIGAEAGHWLYQWYRAGYIELDRNRS